MPDDEGGVGGVGGVDVLLPDELVSEVGGLHAHPDRAQDETLEYPVRTQVPLSLQLCSPAHRPVVGGAPVELQLALGAAGAACPLQKQEALPQVL